MVGISWWEADAFCKWAGGFLPTELQWEAAARGPQGLVYPWGNKWEDNICNSAGARLGGTSAVGIFLRDRSASAGVMDMAGNVLEWCRDLWEPEATFRVLRGGGRGSGAWYCRAAVRNRFVPQDRYDFLRRERGAFRIASQFVFRQGTAEEGDPIALTTSHSPDTDNDNWQVWII